MNDEHRGENSCSMIFHHASEYNMLFENVQIYPSTFAFITSFINKFPIIWAFSTIKSHLFHTEHNLYITSISH